MGTSTFFSLASIKVSVILVCTLGDFIISNTMFPVKLRHEKWDRRQLSRTCKLKHIFPRPCGFDLFFSENSTSCPILWVGYILTCDVQIKKNNSLQFGYPFAIVHNNNNSICKGQDFLATQDIPTVLRIFFHFFLHRKKKYVLHTKA